MRSETSETVSDIEELIWRIAEFEKMSDRKLLCQLMVGCSVFVPADPKTLPKDAIPGLRYRTTSSDRVQIRITRGPENKQFTVAATKRDHPSISEGYVEMEWLDFLRMTSEQGQEFGGLILQGQRSWIGLVSAQVLAALQIAA